MKLQEDVEQGWVRRWFNTIVGTLLGWLITFCILRNMRISTGAALILLFILILLDF